MGKRQGGCQRVIGIGVIGVAAVIIIGLVFGGGEDNGDASRRTPTPGWEERCFSAWDGSVRSVVDEVKAQLVAPDTFEHQETRYTNLRDDGTFGVRMQFAAKNAFGVPLPHTATGTVSPQTCQASGVTITG